MVKPLKMLKFGARNEEKLNDSVCFQMYLWHNQPEIEMNCSSFTLDFRFFETLVLKTHFEVSSFMISIIMNYKKCIFNSVLTNPTLRIEFGYMPPYKPGAQR